MKIFILLFLAFTFPILLFLSMFFYGGISTTVLKENLASSHVYDSLSKYISNIDIEKGPNSETEQLLEIVKKRFTPPYIQGKTEQAIDQSSVWITGASTNAPILSFKEIKDDILAQNPTLMTSLTEVAAQVKQQEDASQAAGEGMTEENKKQLDNVAETISSLSKSDFSIPLEKYLSTIKNIYATMRILYWVMLILTVGGLLLMGFLASSWQSRFRWFGATFLTMGIWGFCVITLCMILMYILAQALLTDNPAIALFSPITLALANYFNHQYTNFLGIGSVTSFVVAAICFIAASVRTTSPTPKVIKKK